MKSAELSEFERQIAFRSYCSIGGGVRSVPCMPDGVGPLHALFLEPFEAYKLNLAAITTTYWELSGPAFESVAMKWDRKLQSNLPTPSLHKAHNLASGSWISPPQMWPR